MAIAEEIQDILRVAKKKGLSKREVQDVLGLSPSASMHKSSAKNVLPLVLLLVAIVWGGIFGFKGPKRIQKDINESFSKSVSCLIDQSEASLEFVRPLSNCTAMCAGMKEVFYVALFDFSIPSDKAQSNNITCVPEVVNMKTRKSILCK